MSRKQRTVVMGMALLTLSALGVLAYTVASFRHSFEAARQGPPSTPATDIREEQTASQPSPTRPGLSASEREYLDTLNGVLKELETALTGLVRLRRIAGQDPSLVLDTDWKISVSGELVAIRFVCDDIRDLRAPARFASSHTYLLEAADHLARGTRIFSDGIDEVSADKIDSADAEWDLGYTALERGLIMLIELPGVPGGLEDLELPRE